MSGRDEWDIEADLDLEQPGTSPVGVLLFTFWLLLIAIAPALVIAAWRWLL